MNLRGKLTLGCFVMTLITLVVSAVAYWQTGRLAGALYEIGVVRLPSIQALDRMFEAKTALDASRRELMRPEAQGEIPQRIFEEENRRQQAAWRRIDRAWALCEPLPRTVGEDAVWQKFVPTWNVWRQTYDEVMGLFAESMRTGDRSFFTAAGKKADERLYDSARESRELLTELIRINEEIASSEREATVASLADMRTVRLVIIGCALLSLAGAIGCGFAMGRIIGLPITRMSEAFSRIAAGDLDTRVVVESHDEIGAMANAMNHMVDSLRTSELRFRALVDNTFDAIGLSKGDLAVFGNPAFLKLFGYDSVDEIVGRPILDFVDPSSHDAVRDRVERRRAGEIFPPAIEITGRRKDGSTFLVEIKGSPLVLNGERHTIAVHRDVTEHRRAQAALAESARRLELAVRTSNLGVWRRNLATGEAQWDERMFAIFGLAVAAAAPRREELIELVVPEDRESTLEAWGQKQVAGEIYRHGFRITRPDGAVRHIETHGALHDAPGQPPGWTIGVAGDITDIVDAVAESARLREQLLQSQKMEALGTLSAGIAHDFNNFLTGIHGFIDLAMTHLPSDSDVAELLREAKTAGTCASALVQRILTFSRQSRTSHRTNADLGAIATGTTALISTSLSHRIEMSIDVADDLPPVLADAGQIQQVLMNLLTNAAHAIGETHGTIRVEIAQCEFGGESGAHHPPAGCRPGAHVCLSVADTGCGMDEATLARMFEPFFSTKSPGKGTGLGLSIVKDIMAVHEGAVEVRSTPGAGTVFLLYFPVAERTAVVV